MSAPLFLYSTNTSLAYHINESYYQGKHYVWCSRFFNGMGQPGLVYTNPFSSCPEAIYKNFLSSVQYADLHSPYISGNASGLKKGVSAKFKAGVIDDNQRKEILSIIRVAQSKTRNQFLPLIYVISFNLVAARAQKAPVKAKANPLSDEYIITDLTRSEFDIIDLRSVINV